MALFARRKKTFSDSSAVEWVIAGLGNPGPKYERTRHNAGFLALDRLAARHRIDVTRLKFRGLLGRGEIAGRQVLLVKPQTFMNNSGECLREVLDFYKVPPERLIVLFDDISLPPGRLRVRLRGSDGGHNGIKSILYHIRSDQFPRVKIGVGDRPHPEMDLADWVLGTVAREDFPQWEDALERAGRACELLVEGSPAEAMNRYNS
ncbi:aminoacyl-tRNA hydrolase [Feifania hominis]|uniref:Peptidyl-tRNA hydrolase n=1 Tax=Feifania hominis TaxID=2763660 RepID=A0A926DFU6_9FIRM|nr:aminoacyl-tRNA hydrolase [Feifania hominis]MBC8537086.1 aminoacyl-tRNA hydrolase [Feifania hominis]